MGNRKAHLLWFVEIKSFEESLGRHQEARCDEQVGDLAQFGEDDQRSNKQ